MLSKGQYGWERKTEGARGDDLAPLFMSPSAETAMRTLSSWSSRAVDLSDEADDERDMEEGAERYNT